MAKDITWVESLEEVAYRNATVIGQGSLITLLVVALLSINISVWLILAISVAVYIGSIILHVMRFGERNGRLADRITILEREYKYLKAGINGVPVE